MDIRNLLWTMVLIPFCVLYGSPGFSEMPYGDDSSDSRKLLKTSKTT